MASNSGPRIVAADAAGLAEAAAILRAGGLVAVPTETVYGLAARADSDAAVAAIYRAKGRPSQNPLIVHVASIAHAEALAILDDRAQALALAFWPGPLTLVLPARASSCIVAAVTAGLPTLAVRCPAHPAVRALLTMTALPLAAPSANRSGGVSPTTAEHVIASLGSTVDLVVDGGACVSGLESTIVALRQTGEWQMLRPGPISADEIGGNLHAPQQSASKNVRIEAPGQLIRHYSPGKPVRLDAAIASCDEFHIGFGAIEGDFNLSPAVDLAQAGAQLYAALHAATWSAYPRIAIAPIPEQGLGIAINDRLRRAAA